MVIWDPVPSLGHKYCLIFRKPGASMLHRGMKNSCDDFCARAGQGRAGHGLHYSLKSCCFSRQIRSRFFSFSKSFMLGASQARQYNVTTSYLHQGSPWDL